MDVLIITGSVMRHELFPDPFDTDPPKDVIQFTSANGIYKLKI